ncbi:MAG: hypothetical protein V3W14_01640 [Candidatus Neomarinimicrobiota bacterium]
MQAGRCRPVKGLSGEKGYHQRYHRGKQQRLPEHHPALIAQLVPDNLLQDGLLIVVQVAQTLRRQVDSCFVISLENADGGSCEREPQRQPPPLGDIIRHQCQGQRESRRQGHQAVCQAPPPLPGTDVAQTGDVHGES